MDLARWFRAWRLLLVGATLFAIGAVGFALMGFWGADEIPAGAAVAFLGLAAIGIGTFIVSLPVAWAFRHGGTVKTVTAVIIILAGTFIYYASGWFFGLLPLWILTAGIGLLALYEEHGAD